jgi:hypothetical protein
MVQGDGSSGPRRLEGAAFMVARIVGQDASVIPPRLDQGRILLWMGDG